MHLILIPLFIIAILVGIYEGGSMWKNLNLSLPSFGEDELNVRQFFSSPANSNNPLRNLSN